MTQTNLWPTDIGQVTAERVPVTLLKEQAALLAQLTKGLVEAEVRSGQDPETGEFVDDFYLVGPIINYQYLLFSLTYSDEFYPARFTSKSERKGQEHSVLVDDDDDLEKHVAQTLNHQKTRQVIGAIIARSK